MDYKFETRCIHRDNEHEEGHPYGSVSVSYTHLTLPTKA